MFFNPIAEDEVLEVIKNLDARMASQYQSLKNLQLN